MARRGVLLIALFLLMFGAAIVLASSTAVSPPEEGTFHGEVDAVSDTGAVEDHPRIHDQQTLALYPERDGEIKVEHAYRIPSTATHFEVGLTHRMTLIEMRGFTRTDDDTLVWDGETDRPSLTYLADVDRKIERDDPLAGPGDYLFKDAGDWALVQRPTPSYGWSWAGDDRLGLTREAAVDGPGTASDVIAFLGEHETHHQAVHGQQFVLVEPVSAELAESPAALFDALAHASDQLRVGDRDEEVFMVAAPTENVRWGVRGLQTGPADMWVRDAEGLDTPDNVWIHEYVHTRQSYSTAPSARWFTEASATYYAALFALDTGEISYDRFRSFLARGGDTRFAHARLNDPSTWKHNPDYMVGVLVSASLDREIRTARDAGASFADVFMRLNEHQGPVTHVELIDIIENVGGEAPATAADFQLSGTDRPPTWSEDDHAAVFGTEPPRFAIQRDSSRDVTITGPYRNASWEDTDEKPVVTGESMAIPLSVTNLGEVSGSYYLRPMFGEEPIDPIKGTISPGESAAHTAERTFDRPKITRFSIDEASGTITVRAPARASVTGIAVDPQRVLAGQTVSLLVTVENEVSYPAKSELTVRKGGESARSIDAHLDVGETKTLELDLTFVQSKSLTVTIDGSDQKSIRIEVYGEERPMERYVGVVLIAAVVAIAVATAVRARWLT